LDKNTQITSIINNSLYINPIQMEEVRTGCINTHARHLPKLHKRWI
jgi:hypothetical protein